MRPVRVAVAAVLVGLQAVTTVVIGLPRPHGRVPQLAARRAAIARLLQVRERAVKKGDLTAWLSTVTTADADFRAHEEKVFVSVRRLPLDTWHYSMNLLGTITLHTQLTGFDFDDQTTTEELTFSDGAHPRITADRSRIRPWDIGETDVTRGVSTLVLHDPADAALATEIARLEDDAIPHVTAVWGSDWAQKVVVELPHTIQEASLLAATPMTNTAGLAIAQFDHGFGVERMVINPEAFDDASRPVRQILLRHETTHIATERVTTDGTPIWLIEGYADLIGFQHVPPRVGASDLADALRRGKVLTRLPTARDYRLVGGDPDLAYEEGWLACRMLGAVRATAVYRAIGTGDSVEDALQHVTGQGLGAFTTRYLAYVKAQLS